MSRHLPPSTELLEQEARDHARACGCPVCRVALIAYEAHDDREQTPAQIAGLAMAMAEISRGLFAEAALRMVRRAQEGL